MSLNYSTGAKNTLLDAGLDTAFDGGALELRSGAKPASADAAPTGTLVASLALPANLWSAAVAGQKTVTEAVTGNGHVNAGTGTAAGHFRLRAAADAGGASTTLPRIDGDVTHTSGAGDCLLDNVSIASGQALSITALTLSVS